MIKINASINLAEIAAQRKDLEAELDRFAENHVRRILLALFASLVRMTPVDTGRARNGWQASLQAPSSYVPAEGLDSYPPPETPMDEAAAFRVGMIAWIVNNVAYIGVLDEGSSQQAPGGMTAVALADLQAQFGGGA